jgi:hypothetical protein
LSFAAPPDAGTGTASSTGDAGELGGSAFEGAAPPSDFEPQPTSASIANHAENTRIAFM